VATGLCPPEATIKAVEQAIIEEDWLSAYVKDRCDTTDTRATELFRDVYWDYCAWCREDGNDPEGKGTFGSMLGERFEKRRGSSNKVTVFGLRLRNQPKEGQWS
jgi:phage/plasmid-associated DNA primase